MSLADMTLREFTEKLGSSSAVPGGGGATALTAALGAGLASMVGALTAGKPKYAAVDADMRRLMAESEAIRARLVALVDVDAELFAPLSRAYSLPKDAPGRDATMEKCLLDACAAPMEIMELACRAIELHEELAEKGSALAISDAATGAVLCWAALYGGAANVLVNTRLMKNREKAEELNARATAMMESHWVVADRVYEGVMERLR